ncbi:lysine transporter LysE [Xenorhabdus mauleonii]|uniref:Lysine transporter LysE n=1 Tax=Xenorhabdus mauleonii TaxID=351675 RepID=A0A1I3RXR7_9GAMM|nr:LysE family translocator [Xenorhabdus mauleonii]PHM46385.1 lysine transporter LysE [Xenorhabdus mauleonii]SFJ50820.1 Threonine/homoserine/homoserine lactone efflux protein [Xenorhabdus mauleonii]
MPEIHNVVGFSFIALGMVLTPGPNMIYLISRSICQGRIAGLVSLIGVAVGFVFYMLCAAFGITTFLMMVPFAYDTLRIAGACYLIYLAWQAVRPRGKSPFEVKELQPDSNKKLFTMGFITNLLNPKIAVMYLSLLPQFISPGHCSVLSQSLFLGFTQIIISVAVNTIIVLSASTIAVHLSNRPVWLQVQRYLMGTVLFGLATKMMINDK